MKKKTVLLAAGVLLTSTAFAQTGSQTSGSTWSSKSDRSAQQAQTDQQNPAGKSAASAQDIKSGVAKTLDSTVNALASNKPISKVESYISAKDKSRIKQGENTALDRSASQFQSTWRSKFNRGFSTDVFAKNMAQSFQVTPSPDQRTASVEIPAQHDLPPVHLRMVKEGTLASNWKVDLPESVNASELQRSLEQTYSDLNQTSLPSDRSQAELYASHQLLLALASPQQAGPMGQRGRMGETYGSQSQTGQTGGYAGESQG
jgi:hypothetical protein